MTEDTADRYALLAAGAVILVLTIAGFWLSYAHLAEVAGHHGLARSPERQWTWPATLDAFIVAGELLMLRAGLRRTTDWWAIGLTVTGSTGSIALNVAGVAGTTSGPVPVLDYVVAAVPPTGAMLAFGVLMRQIHQRVARPTRTAPSEPKPGPAARTETERSGTLAGPDRTKITPDNPDGSKPGRRLESGRTARDPDGNPDRHEPGRERAPGRTRTAPRPRTVRAKVAAGRQGRSGPSRLSEDEVVARLLPHVPTVLTEDGNAQLTRDQLRRIMRAQGVPLSNDHLGPVLKRLRAELTTTSAHFEGASR
ncbi:DUF2637 domain-containing protein [Streptomyces noboritoensis]|uniref:DUF2637 domain-containing protein n=1 Tax=Streptomyces noboritoensis TaxID=67337 RepID=A0ABV6TFW4_9ACTN